MALQNDTEAHRAALADYSSDNSTSKKLKVDISEGFDIPSYNYFVGTYDANDNMLTATFKTGGASGTIVAVITMTYDSNNNLLTALKS